VRAAARALSSAFSSCFFSAISCVSIMALNALTPAAVATGGAVFAASSAAAMHAAWSVRSFSMSFVVAIRKLGTAVGSSSGFWLSATIGCFNPLGECV
jgi:hypothetical protein